MLWKVGAAIAAIGVAATTPAAAHDFASGYTQIAAGDLKGAEAVIADQQRMFPRDADLLLNLAYLQAQSGRTAEAMETYRRVLAQPDDAMDLADGSTVASHVLAKRGIARLTTTRTASR